MDISDKAGDEIEALLKAKTGAPGNFHFSIVSDTIYLSHVQHVELYRPFLKQLLQKNGIGAEVEVIQGTRRASEYKYEKVEFQPQQFQEFLKSIGAEKEYEAILEKPIASDVVVGRMGDEPVNSVTFYYPTKAAAMAAYGKIPEAIREERDASDKLTCLAGRSGKRPGNYFVTFPLTPDKSATEYMRIAENLAGKDVSTHDQTLRKLLGEQTLTDTERAKNAASPNRYSLAFEKEWMNEISNGIKEIEKVLESAEKFHFGPEATQKLNALKAAMDAVKRIDKGGADYVNAVAHMQTAMQAVQYESAFDPPSDNRTDKNQVNAWESFGKPLFLAANERLFKHGIEAVSNFMAADAALDAFEVKREKEAGLIVQAIDQGLHGEALRKALQTIRKNYANADCNGDGKPDIDTDRDSKADTSVQVLCRIERLANDTHFEHLILDYESTQRKAAGILEQIKKGELGESQREAYLQVQKWYDKEILPGHTNIEKLTDTALDTLEKIGKKANVEAYMQLRGIMGRDINALDDIAEWRKAPDTPTPSNPRADNYQQKR